MSVFMDFKRVWIERFPDSALPAALEEDVRSNLAKHKAKVISLREELRREEVYVEFLENLLLDVEQAKSQQSDCNVESSPTIDDSNVVSEDKECDFKKKNTPSLQTPQSDATSSTNGNSFIDEKQNNIQRRNPGAKTPTSPNRNTVNQCINELSDRIDRENFRRRCNSDVTLVVEEEKATTVLENSKDPSLGNTNKRPQSSIPCDFITVIEVNKDQANGHKRNDQKTPNKNFVDSMAISSSESSQSETTVATKKVPPKPPPKTSSKRSIPTLDQQSDDSPTSSLGRADSNASTTKSDSNLKEFKNPSRNETNESETKVSTESEQSKDDSETSGERSSPNRSDSVHKKVDYLMASLTRSELGKRNLSSADSRESITSHSSSITEKVKSYESLNSTGSDRQNHSKRVGGKIGTPEPLKDIDDVKSAPVSLESIPSLMPMEDEPFYDSVPNDLLNDGGEYVYIQAGGTRNIQSVSDNNDDKSNRVQPSAPRAPESPQAPNYVNIHFFLQQNVGSEAEVSGVASGSGDNELEATPQVGRSLMHQESTVSNPESERNTMQRCIINSIIETETIYLECLYIMDRYMYAIKASVNSSQPVISEEEFNTIFYKIPELHEMHKKFIEGLKAAVANPDEPLSVGIHFKKMAESINIYGAFLHNYGRATHAVRRRNSSSTRFAELSRNMKLKGQPVCLEDLLHKPVARVQQNALVLHDLIKWTPKNHPDYALLSDALKMTRSFLDQFNIIQTKSMFPCEDRAQRRLVKNSFIVELSDGNRKMRHLFLFNDVIACAKDKPSGRDKLTFELKWFIPIADIVIMEESAETKELSPANIVALKSQASTYRDQILAEEKEDDKKFRLSGKSERLRKKLAELEGQLVLASPNLVFRIAYGNNSSRIHTFYLSSEYERTQWIDSIQALQASSTPPSGTAVSMFDLQAWVTATSSYVLTDMGSYLMRSSREEGLLLGDMQLFIGAITAPIDVAADYYIIVEVDSYGHFFRKAKSKLVCRSNQPRWNEMFVIELEGSQNLRLLLYEDANRPLLKGKCTLKLCREWSTELSRSVQLGSANLSIKIKILPPELTLRRVPSSKPGALFGAKIQQVCKREKRHIPFVLYACIREVERRGLCELGLYRMSGSTSDLLKLKKSFETNAYEAEQLLKEVDIHSVTGVLKMFLRELPESLMGDTVELTRVWQAAVRGGASARYQSLQRHIQQLPEDNRACLNLLLDHLVKVNSREGENKMSLNNLATVIGPTLLKSGNNKNKTDLLASETVDAMAQAEILYTLLQHRQISTQVSAHHANST